MCCAGRAFGIVYLIGSWRKADPGLDVPTFVDLADQKDATGYVNGDRAIR
jgi:hypothetical protein